MSNTNSALVEQLDSAVEVLLKNPDGTMANIDPNVAELLGVAAELRALPRSDFRAQLQAELMQRAYGGNGVPETTVGVAQPVGSRPETKDRARLNQQVLPTLFGQGSGTCGMRGSNFAASVLAHAAVLALVLTSGLWIARTPAEVRPEAARLPQALSV